eukprot:2638991-Prymnesium_polylepis.1
MGICSARDHHEWPVRGQLRRPTAHSHGGRYTVDQCQYLRIWNSVMHVMRARAEYLHEIVH